MGNVFAEFFSSTWEHVSRSIQHQWLAKDPKLVLGRGLSRWLHAVQLKFEANQVRSFAASVPTITGYCRQAIPTIISWTRSGKAGIIQGIGLGNGIQDLLSEPKPE